jgi:hypothetical protein
MIAVLLLSERQDFQQEQASLAREASTREGVPIEIAFADNSPFAQIQQVLAYIRRPLDTRPTAIVAELAGAAEAYTTVARRALAAGVGWVDLSPAGSTLQPLRAEFPGRLAIAIGTDEVAIGRIHAHQCRAFLPDEGGILYVEGPRPAAGGEGAPARVRGGDPRVQDHHREDAGGRLDGGRG